MKNNNSADKDVLEMLSSLRDYDILTESVAPVLGGMRNIIEDGDQLPEPPEEIELDLDEEDENPTDEAEVDLGETSASIYEDADEDDEDEDDEDASELDESADQEVLAWMKRFEGLGKIV